MVKVVWLFVSIICMGCHKKDADLLMYNGIIYTVNEGFDIAEALVISGGKIIETGSSSALRQRYDSREQIDLKGKPVYPGFIDAHCHFYGYGLSLKQADLTGSLSPEEIIARLKKHQLQFPSSWLLGRGWDQNDWDNQKFPDKFMLDKAFPDIPVYLTRIDGHAAWVNSKAMSVAGIKPGTIVEGGEVQADQQGATGILLDNAMTLVENHIPANNANDRLRALQMAERNCFEVGLTTVGDAGLNKDVIILIDSLQKAGKLKMRIYAMLNPTTENIAYFMNQGIYVTDSISVRSVKMYADGALGSRGALLLDAYQDEPQNYGIAVSTAAYLSDMCRLALEKGYQVNTHCIGDSAVRLILGIYGSCLPVQNDLRWRIEHAQVVHPDDYDKFVTYRIIPSVQPTHATSDMPWAGERLGSDRLKHAYTYKTLLELNGWLANGSDFPVESINPVYGFYAAIARKDLKGNPESGFMKDEALTREQALRAMTVWAAKACFEENHKGSLETGKYADLVILDKDIMTAEEITIPAIRVLQTFINGEPVFSSNNLPADGR